MIRNIIRVLLTIMIIMWMSVIFGFSSADGETSQSTSDKITKVVVDNCYKSYSDLPNERQQEIWNKISFAVRKIGHFGEYAILAVLISTLMLTFNKIATRKRYLVSVVILCCIYAMTDEFHQSFVAGRSPKVFDVCVDTTGAACGTVFLAACHYIISRIKIPR